MTLSGTFPAHKTFINFVRECKTRKPLSGEGQNTASLRWLARRPERPGGEPLAKDLRALEISASEIWTGGGTESVGRVGGQEEGCSSSTA